MKRFRRRLLSGTAALSLLLCLATAALWIRSYFRLDDISHTGQWHIHNFSSLRGRTFIQWGWATEDELKRANGPYARGGFVWETASGGVTLGVEPMSCGWRLGGFDYFSWTGRKNAAGQPTVGEHVFIVPWWFLTTAAAAIAHLVVDPNATAGTAGDVRLVSNLWVRVAAHPDRCPECGTIPPKKEMIPT